MRARSSAALAGGAVILGAILLVALLAPWLAPARPEQQNLERRLAGPSAEAPLGTDDLGRDVLSRLLWGTRLSLACGLAVVLLAGGFGVAFGCAAGYAAGALDALLVALVDLLLGFPGVLLAIAVVAVVGPGAGNVVLALCLVGWVAYARLARALARRLRSEPFVEAARALGAPARRVVARHVLPNLLAPVLAQAALGLGGAILAEAGLSFLGLGVPPPAPSWGGMLRSGSQNLLDAPHLAIAPGAAIFATVLGANFLADGIRTRLDAGPERERTVL